MDTAALQTSLTAARHAKPAWHGGKGRACSRADGALAEYFALYLKTKNFH